MSDPYDFWRAQLAGDEPETTPGTPHAGFYHNEWRVSEPNPKPTVGGPRRKVRIIPGVCAIWFDDGQWLCRIDSAERVTLISGRDDVDMTFARVCRKAISHETYSQKVNEYDRQRSCSTGAEASPAGERREDSGDHSAVDGGRLSVG